MIVFLLLAHSTSLTLQQIAQNSEDVCERHTRKGIVDHKHCNRTARSYEMFSGWADVWANFFGTVTILEKCYYHCWHSSGTASTGLMKSLCRFDRKGNSKMLAAMEVPRPIDESSSRGRPFCVSSLRDLVSVCVGTSRSKRTSWLRTQSYVVRKPHELTHSNEQEAYQIGFYVQNSD